MTRIADFFGVPQPPRHTQREWMIENRGIALEEDLTINQFQQNQRNIPQENVVNHGLGVEPPGRIVMLNRNQDVDEAIH